MYTKMKEMREYEGLTQSDVANTLGVVRSTYAGYESGKDIIPLTKLFLFAKNFKVTMGFLVGWEDNKIVTNYKEIDRDIIAYNLKKTREKNHLTQKQMAEILKTSQANIHKYETGKSLITTTYALEFAKQFNYSIDDFVTKKVIN